MSVELTIAVVTALVGLLSAAELALVNSAIAVRAGIDEELRAKRLETYPVVWKNSAAVSRWPRQDGSRTAIADLHQARTWYYDVGGLFLSESARARYGDVQELIETLLRHDTPGNSVLTVERYGHLMATMSAFRTALTQDLDTRRRRSWLESRRRDARHATARRQAQGRIARAAHDDRCFVAQ